MSAARILIIEDSDAIRIPVATALTAHGFAVQSAPDGADLEARLHRFAADLVILDVMLLGRDGFALLAVVRRTNRAAVLMLTARDTLSDRLQGLTAGADDYLVKPFAMAELVARVTAVLRRSRVGGSSISVEDLVINDDASLVRRDGAALELTDTERRLLGYLAAHRDRVVSKTQILTAIWGYDGFDENVVEVHVSSLRRKLENGGRSRLLHTVLAVIDVWDSDPGVPPSERERIFERLVRLDDGRPHDSGGSGLGLAIARGYARAHGRDLRCEDPRGPGALFRLTLPLVPRTRAG